MNKKMCYGIIYLLKNRINNKCYVGQSAVGHKERMSTHLRDSKGKSPALLVDQKIKQYGWYNFDKIELVSCLTNQEDLNELERFFIKYFNSKVENGCGYNVREGGSNGAIAEETKDRISKANKGKKNALGCHRSDEFKKILSSKQYHKVKVFSVNFITKEKRFFDSISQASKELKVSRPHICGCLKGTRCKTGGYAFFYYNGIDSDFEFKPKDTSRQIRVSSFNKKTNEVLIFESMADAARALSVPMGKVSACTLGHRKSSKGYTFTRLPKEDTSDIKDPNE